MRLDVRSRGLAASAARRVAAADVVWADSIFVMESEHKKQLLGAFRKEAEYRHIYILDIPDNYDFMDSELITLITAGVREALGEEGTP